MAVWFMDGFDHYCDWPFAVPPVQATTDLLKKWSSGAAMTGQCIGAGFARQQPGQGLRFAGNVQVKKTRAGASVDTFIIGFAFQFNVVNVANPTFLVFEDTGSEQVSVRTDASGHILFNRGSTNLAISTNTLSAGVWYYLECKTKVHPSAGTYEVRINGTATGWIPAASGANTRSTANSVITGIQIGGTTNLTVYLDDLYAADTTGAANTDFLGPQMIQVMRPVAAGHYTQWTPNYGQNYGNVGEQYPDGDASFNQDATPGHYDSFTMSKLLPAAATITAIQHVLCAKQDAGAQRVAAPMERTGGGTDRDGTSFNLTTSYAFYLDPKDVDPDTSAAFTLANLNACEFGYKLVS